MTRKQNRCLNTLLSMNALLLGGVLWTQLADRPMLDSSADAQMRAANTANNGGIPDAAQQRENMIQTILEMKKSVDSLTKTLESGDLKVEVSNLDEVKIQVK